jgi:hypothetical protein
MSFAKSHAALVTAQVNFMSIKLPFEAAKRLNPQRGDDNAMVNLSILSMTEPFSAFCALSQAKLKDPK